MFLLLLAVTMCEGFSFSPKLDVELGSFFQANQKGWMGADVASSTPLAVGNDTYLWLWGDTLYGYLADGQRHMTTMPRNSLSIVKMHNHKPDSQHIYVKTDTHNPKNESLGFFTPEPTPGRTTWFWVYDAVSFADSLYIIASEMATNNDTPPWNFETFTTGIILVENPATNPYEWKYKYHPLPFTKQLVALWNGFSRDDKYIYLTGNNNIPRNSPSILARLDTQLFRALQFDKIEYWSAVNSSLPSWNQYVDGLVLQGLFSDFPPYTLRYHPYLRQWYSVSLFPFTFDVHLLTAPEITGPWTNTALFPIPDPWNQTNIFCYSILSHPEFQTKENEIVFSFMCNGPWEKLVPDLWLYVPQFVRVDIRN